MNTYGGILNNLIEGFQLIDFNWRYLYLNDAIVRQSRYTRREDLLGFTMMAKYPGIESSEVFVVLQDCMQNRVSRHMENEFTFPDNTVGWFELRINPVPEGISILSIDITERKKAEQALKKSENRIRHFAHHLNRVLEDERASIAREIHDELGQQLAGIKMSIASLKKINPDGRPGDEYIASMMQDIDHTIQSLRKIATELRPGILDTLGLLPSLQWLVNEFRRKNPGIEFIMILDATESKCDPALATCFFRVCQEALTNVTKHAEASEVVVEITHNPGQFNLKVSDNGKGILSDKLENPFSVGLLGMHERAAQAGAQLNITGNNGTGTRVELHKTF